MLWQTCSMRSACLTYLGLCYAGVLFAFEEASTFFSPKLMWRCLTCTSLSCFTLSLIRAWEHADAERRPARLARRPTNTPPR